MIGITPRSRSRGAETRHRRTPFAIPDIIACSVNLDRSGSACRSATGAARRRTLVQGVTRSRYPVWLPPRQPWRSNRRRRSNLSYGIPANAPDRGAGDVATALPAGDAKAAGAPPGSNDAASASHRSWLLTAPILAHDAVGPSTPTVLNNPACDACQASITAAKPVRR